MSNIHGSQKFISRNRPPRVQIECDEAIDTDKIKINIPFVAGVLADLSGFRTEGEEISEAEQETRGEFDKRKFVEINAKTFNEVMKTMKPRVSFNVQDTITGVKGSTVPVELNFESMDDFSPASIAEKVGPIKELLEQRRALANLKRKASSSSELRAAMTAIAPNKPVGKALRSAGQESANESADK